jgi:hypothetical protein
LADGVVAMSMRIVSIVQPLCSMSNTANSAPASAARRAMPVVLNSNMNAPIATPPAASRCLTRLVLIVHSLLEGLSGRIVVPP